MTGNELTAGSTKTETTDRPFVSQLIRERRNRKGWRQDDLAERLGVARNTIIRWEKGNNQPDEPQRRKLAATLGGSPPDYEWSELDHEQHDRLTRIKLELNATLRRLMAGEPGE
jgi:transcriptional regulator with XRE-family HTH domain